MRNKMDQRSPTSFWMGVPAVNQKERMERMKRTVVRIKV